MKKVFNLSIILAALTAALTFSSCGNDDDKEAPEIVIGSITETGVYGQILTDSDLKSVDLQQDGRSVTGWPKSDFKDAGQPISGKDGNYNINISGLTPGTKYKLVAVDKADKQDSKEFTTLGGAPVIDWPSGTNTITANGTYYYKQGTTIGQLVVSSLSATSVKVSLDGKAEVTLSDADMSYLLNDGTASKQAGVNADNFLLAKKNGVAVLVDVDGLSTTIAGAQTVTFVKK